MFDNNNENNPVRKPLMFYVLTAVTVILLLRVLSLLKILRLVRFLRKECTR